MDSLFLQDEDSIITQNELEVSILVLMDSLFLQIKMLGRNIDLIMSQSLF